MSTSEYHDLFIKCQSTGKYHMFCFDIANSKKMSKEKRREAQDKIIKLMNNIYYEIEEIEKNINHKILVFEEDFVRYDSGKTFRGFGLKVEPILFGDAFGFTIYRDSLDKETIYKIFEYHKKLLNIDFELHTKDGYYETNDYAKGGTEYFRGYCFDVLTNFHKPHLQEELSIIRKK